MIKGIYIAAPFGRKTEAREARKWFGEVYGIPCTSRWIDAHNSDELTDAVTLRTEAAHDLHDIEMADALILLNYPEMIKEGTGGKHIEFGFALRSGKVVWVIGERSSIFHHLPDVRFAGSLQEVKL